MDYCSKCGNLLSNGHCFNCAITPLEQLSKIEEQFVPKLVCPRCGQETYNGFNCQYCGYFKNVNPNEWESNDKQGINSTKKPTKPAGVVGVGYLMLVLLIIVMMGIFIFFGI